MGSRSSSSRCAPAEPAGRSETKTYSEVGSLATVVGVRRAGARSRALALAIATSGPAGPGVEVIWEAPASCPDAPTARAEILARVADGPAARELRATARVRALDDGTFEVEVELRREGDVATRTLRAASCNEALTATAVVVAIAVDPSLEPVADDGTPVETLVPPPPSDASGEVPAVSVVEDEEEAASSTRERGAAGEAGEAPAPSERRSEAAASPRELGLSLGVRGGLDFGALPSPAGHVAGAVGIFGRRFVVQAGALHRIRTQTTVELPQPVGGRFRLTAASLSAGPRLRWGAFELPLAAGLELGAIWARGIGAGVEPIPVRRTWLAAVASAGVGWAPRLASPRASFALHLGLDGVVPLLRPEFTLDDAVDVLTVGTFAIRAWLGVLVRFSL